MNLQDEPQLAERQIAFLRYLSRRTEVVGKRLQRFSQSGWDINGLSLIQLDAARLGEASLEHSLDELSRPLSEIAALLAGILDQETLPDPVLAERLTGLTDSLRAALPQLFERDYTLPDARPTGHSSRSESPPANYWRRWTQDAEPLIAAPATDETAADDFDPWSNNVRHFGRAPTSVAASTVDTAQIAVATPTTIAPSLAQAAPATVFTASTSTLTASSTPTAIDSGQGPILPQDLIRLSLPSGYRLYHLTHYGPLSLELDQRLEAQGVEIELLENVEELKELLGALPADLVLIDASFSDQLDGIGETVRQARKRSSKRLLLMAISEADDIGLRLSARRAGVDALVVGPTHVNDVFKRLQALADPDREAPFRILIVEDDRSQALFAEGILRKAGMDSLVVLEALGVIRALEQFQPDLILMDLNMPDADGIELTTLIRENEAYAATPIVFLSGESDENRQFDAIDAGGDDFLPKPIRPRHLISAVQNRVRRYREIESRRSKRSGKIDAATGLLYRAEFLQLLGARLAASEKTGGVLFLEIESLSQLRERLGLSALEHLLGEVSRLLSATVGLLPITRFGDGSYLVLDSDRDETALESLAVQARNALVQQPFQVQGHPLRLRLSVGVCAFKHGFEDTNALLNAVEKAAREALTHERGVRRYEPPQSGEADREASLRAHIREAISNRHLELLYQPMVSVAGTDNSQYQVLLRLRDTEGKLLSAAEIIPMAERAHVIVDIDRWVTLQALALLRDRRSDDRALRLFVTQSTLTLADSSQAAWLKTELAAHAVPGSCLAIELRAEDAAAHLTATQRFCGTMVAEGVKFCLSQYEPGAEPLLEQLPLGFVKLSRKYTADSLTPALREELRELIERAHRHGLEVIGHGVENAQSAAKLWLSGIDFIQGNLVQQADNMLDFHLTQTVL